MRQEVERLKYLYSHQKIAKNAVDTLYSSGKITIEEYKYILGNSSWQIFL